MWNKKKNTLINVNPPDLTELYSISICDTWSNGQEQTNYNVSCKTIQEAENLYKKLLDVEGKVNVPIVMKEKSFNV